MATVITGRLEALIVALRGIGDHPEQVDIGPWRWSPRPTTAVACWRHADNWNRTVEVRPVSMGAVAIQYPDGTYSDSYPRERRAIEDAIAWLREDTA